MGLTGAAASPHHVPSFSPGGLATESKAAQTESLPWQGADGGVRKPPEQGLILTSGAVDFVEKFIHLLPHRGYFGSS